MTDDPIAYGYVRVRLDVGDDDLRLIEKELYTYAEAHALRLAYIHYDGGPGLTPSDLVRRLLRNDVRHVIMSSLSQITEHRLLALRVEEAIEWDAGAELHEARGLCGQPAG